MATTNGIDKALVAQKLQNSNAVLARDELKYVVAKFQGEISSALPVHLKQNAEKYARQLFSLITINPKLQACTASTLLTSLMTASSLGLDLTPQLGQCYIIPYDNSKRDGKAFVKVTEAQFQLGYRGVIALAQRSGEVTRIQADVVRAKDRFKYSKGLNPILEHEESVEEDRGEITHIYAVANFKNGGYSFEVWPVAKVIAHAKKTSKSYYKDEWANGRKTGDKIINEKSPWHTDFESMAEKTLIMAIWKYLPLSTEVMLAASVDETIKDDVSTIQKENDVITIQAKDIEDEPEALEAPKEDTDFPFDNGPEAQQDLAPIDPNMLPFDNEPTTHGGAKVDTSGYVSEAEKLRDKLAGILNLTAQELDDWCDKKFGKGFNALSKDELRAAIKSA